MGVSLTYTLPVAAYHVFGSGSATCSLKFARTGKPIRGANPSARDNGFVGFVHETVTLYRATPVKFIRSAYPGGTDKFEGTWEQLVLERVRARFTPAFAGANPGWVASNLTKSEAENLASLVIGGRVQRPEFTTWENGPSWSVAVDGPEPICV